MTGASSEGAAAPSDGVAKKDLVAYIKKAKVKIRKLEEQNKASAVDAGETAHTRHNAPGLLFSLLLGGNLTCSTRCV